MSDCFVCNKPIYSDEATRVVHVRCMSTEKLKAITEEMRSERSRYKSHDLGFTDSVSANRVDDWADEIEAVMTPGCDCDQRGVIDPEYHSLDCEWRAREPTR